VPTATQPFMMNRRTEPATRGRIDPADTLYAAVKAYNTRQVGRSYEPEAPEALFDAVKAFNARRQAGRVC
jgi:hypothetical protein